MDILLARNEIHEKPKKISLTKIKDELRNNWKNLLF